MPVDPFRLLAKVVIVMVWMPYGVALAQTPGATATAPPLPSLATPVDYFRQLLSAKPEERERLLSGRTAEHRKVLESSLRAYETLTPEERDVRLRTLELRFR